MLAQTSLLVYHCGMGPINIEIVSQRNAANDKCLLFMDPMEANEHSCSAGPKAHSLTLSLSCCCVHQIDMIHRSQSSGSRDKSATPPEKKKVVQKLNFDNSGSASMLGLSSNQQTPAPITPAQPKSEVEAPTPLPAPKQLAHLEAGEPATPPVETSSNRLGAGGSAQRPMPVVPKAVTISKQPDMAGILQQIHSTATEQLQQPGKARAAATKTAQESSSAGTPAGSTGKKSKASPLPAVPSGSAPPPQSFKRCNCKNSKCLKLYCDCFKTGMYCKGCSCRDCQNTEEHKGIVESTVQLIKQRNPDVSDALCPFCMPICVHVHMHICMLLLLCLSSDAAFACFTPSGLCRQNCRRCREGQGSAPHRLQLQALRLPQEVLRVLPGRCHVWRQLQVR